MSREKTKSYKEKFERPDIGERIKFVRGEITQDAFAKILGTTQGSVARWEKGLIPPAEILDRIAEYAGRNIRWFLRGEQETQDNSHIYKQNEINGVFIAEHDPLWLLYQYRLKSPDKTTPEIRHALNRVQENQRTDDLSKTVEELLAEVARLKTG